MSAFTLLRDDLLVNNTDFEKTAMNLLAFDSYSYEMMPTKYMTDENIMAYENFFAPIPTSSSTDKEVQKKFWSKPLMKEELNLKILI